jgi:hypothetical protein
MLFRPRANASTVWLVVMIGLIASQPLHADVPLGGLLFRKVTVFLVDISPANQVMSLRDDDQGSPPIVVPACRQGDARPFNGQEPHVCQP